MSSPLEVPPLVHARHEAQEAGSAAPRGLDDWGLAMRAVNPIAESTLYLILRVAVSLWEWGDLMPHFAFSEGFTALHPSPLPRSPSSKHTARNAYVSSQLFAHPITALARTVEEPRIDRSPPPQHVCPARVRCQVAD